MSGWGVDAGLRGFNKELGVDYGNGLRSFERCDLFYSFRKPPASVSAEGLFGGRGSIWVGHGLWWGPTGRFGKCFGG